MLSLTFHVGREPWPATSRPGRRAGPQTGGRVMAKRHGRSLSRGPCRELDGAMAATDWFLSAEERGNRATRLDRRHDDAKAWTSGNQATALVHGDRYFGELKAHLEQLRAGDLAMFTDWRGDPDELLDDLGTEVSDALCAAAQRGVVVKGLVWRSHLDRLSFSEQQNRHLGEEINAAGGECLLDMRVRPGGSPHQKFVILRHPG